MKRHFALGTLVVMMIAMMVGCESSVQTGGIEDVDLGAPQELYCENQYHPCYIMCDIAFKDDFYNSGNTFYWTAAISGTDTIKSKTHRGDAGTYKHVYF